MTIWLTRNRSAVLFVWKLFLLLHLTFDLLVGVLNPISGLNGSPDGTGILDEGKQVRSIHVVFHQLGIGL